MVESVPANLDAFLDEFGTPKRSLVVVNRSEPGPVQRLLEGAFANQPVEVTEEQVPDAEGDVVVLVEDREVRTTTSLDDLMDAYLLVNADRYRTGTTGLDSDPPGVLAELDGTVFRLRGFPASNKEKLLLILVSRFIEKRALDAGNGTLRSTFQRLSRIDDERGTRKVYERLAETDLDVHVYGRPDWEPPDSFGPTVHGGTGREYRRSWCVAFRPDGGEGHAALAAVEQDEANVWRGAWTYDPDRVARVERYLAERL